MSPQVAPSRPWRPNDTRLAMRGRVMLTVKSGEAPSRIATHRAVSAGMAMAAPFTDGGSIDRVVQRHSPRARITRAFEARRTAGTPEAHRGWDDLEVETGLSRTFRLEVDPDASILNLVDALRQLNIVEEASPHYLCQAPFAAPRGPRASSRYGWDMVGAGRALSMEPGDTALIVGVIDSGLAFGHPAFDPARIRPGADMVDLPSTQVSRSLTLFGDSSGRDRTPLDEVGHGTACAGIIGGRGAGGFAGVGGACRLLPVRCLAGARVTDRSEPTALGALADIDDGVKLAVDLGARVLNLSFGTPGTALGPDDPIPHERVIRYALARGAVLVAASGNSGDRTKYYPAALDGVITVGSVGPTGKVSRFTTRGDHVDLCAPGESIHAPSIKGYSRVSGTSFAAPFVAGACALLMARAARNSAALPSELISRVLVSSARSFPASEAGDGAGAGILDLPSALRMLDDLVEHTSPLSTEPTRTVGTAPAVAAP